MQRTLQQFEQRKKQNYNGVWLLRGKAMLNKRSSSIFFAFLIGFVAVSLVNAAPQHPLRKRISYNVYPPPFYNDGQQPYLQDQFNFNPNDDDQSQFVNFNHDEPQSPVPVNVVRPQMEQHFSTLHSAGSKNNPIAGDKRSDPSTTSSWPVKEENLMASTADTPIATITPTRSESVYPLGLSKPAFIVSITSLALISLLSLCGTILFYVRRRQNARRLVQPEYKVLKLLSERTYDSRGSQFDRPSTTLLPAREFLFPTQLSAAHHKTIYGAKNADAAVWDVKTDIERRSTIRVPKTRKRWFPALQSRAASNKEKKEPSSEEQKMERARKTTSWFAAFKSSSGDSSNADNVTKESSSSTEEDQVVLPIPPVPAASRRTATGRSPKPELLDNAAAEKAKKAFLAGLDLRDSRIPKLPSTTTRDSSVDVNSSAHRVKLAGRLERIEGQTPRREKQDKLKDLSPSNSLTMKPKSGDSQTQDSSAKRSTIIRRETLRSKNASASAARRSMMAKSAAEKEMPSFNQDTSLNNSTNDTSTQNKLRSPPPLPVKRQSLFGETELDLEKYSKVD